MKKIVQFRMYISYNFRVASFSLGYEPRTPTCKQVLLTSAPQSLMVYISTLHCWVCHSQHYGCISKHIIISFGRSCFSSFWFAYSL